MSQLLFTINKQESLLFHLAKGQNNLHSIEDQEGELIGPFEIGSVNFNESHIKEAADRISEKLIKIVKQQLESSVNPSFH